MTNNAHSAPARFWVRLVPRSLREAITILFRTPGYARPALVRRWLTQTAAGVSPNRIPVAPRLLFVCHGNILRSAAAEALATRMVHAGELPAETAIGSAGTHAVDGKPADPRGIAVAVELGVSLDSHRARRLTAEQVAEADLILAMDLINEAEIVARFPNSEKKVLLLGRFGPGPEQVPDPYMGDEAAVRAAFHLVDRSLRAMASLVRERSMGTEY